jgi:hypothetical protein
MSAISLQALAGQLTLRPGAPLGQSLHSSRPDLVPRLTRGRQASQLPALLGSVFSLCGHAHRWTAHSAVRAAQGDLCASPAAEGQAHRLATLREQMLRISHDWPRLLPGAGTAAPLAGLLRSCPLWQEGLAPAQQLADLPGWLAQHWLGQSPADWLQAWQADPGAAPLAWARRTPGPLADLLACQAPAMQALPAAGPTLALLSQPTLSLPMLARAMASEPGFCLAPHWQGETPDTGPWQREGHHPHRLPCSAWDRLLARLVEVLLLAQPAGEQLLRHGALALGPGVGLAWTEMARGLLVHRVALDDADGPLPRVADCRVLAPTEWNCHPQGLLARAIAALPAEPASADAAARLAVAFDPCVPFHIEIGPPLGEDAACTETRTTAHA